MKASDAVQQLKALATPEVAAGSARFFKTGPGQYGEGDIFIGVRVPVIRKLAKEYQSLPLSEVDALLQSTVHEERLLGLLVLVLSLGKKPNDYRSDVYRFYLERTDRVNNWDLVDTSAPPIVGGYLRDKPAKDRRVLDRLAKSPSVWERRIAIVATQWLIRDKQFEDTLRVGEKLLGDRHDLIHKAVGWMLREVGEQDEPTLASFLMSHAAVMPRTMLRYAIEHYTPAERKAWMEM